MSERRIELNGMLKSYAWLEVARPALLKRSLRVQERLAQGRSLGIESLRDLQGQYSILKLLIEKPELYLWDDDFKEDYG